MWWGRKEGGGGGDSNHASSESPSSSTTSEVSPRKSFRNLTGTGTSFRKKKSSNTASTNNINKVGGLARRFGRQTGHSEPGKDASVTTVSDEERAQMHVAETGSGIEVSFSAEHAVSQQEVKADDGVISFYGQLTRKRKIYRGQYCVATLSEKDETNQEEKKLEDMKPPGYDFSVGRHRIPFFGKQPAGNSTNALFDDVLFLLRSHEVRDEFSCVREELAHMTDEIGALEKDRKRLDQEALKLKHAHSHSGGLSSLLSSDTDDITKKGGTHPWEIHRILAHEEAGKISPEQRASLQSLRGMSLTVSLHNLNAREVFLSRCGCVSSNIRQQVAANGLLQIIPSNCRDGGAAATVQHVTLLPGATGESAFFISRDKGKSYYWGHLPDRLFRRMKGKGGDPRHYASELLYLATGPKGCYYAMFRSGEAWWASLADDKEFDAICRDKNWDIHRVAFGAISTMQDRNGVKHVTVPWIIIGRDGRVAWKNLPSRLHNKLESRLASEPAPVEVALGNGGSYFVRFLDGTTDYCLPAAAARACRSIEELGLSITSVSLHPELSHDFVIRHG